MFNEKMLIYFTIQISYQSVKKKPFAFNSNVYYLKIKKKEFDGLYENYTLMDPLTLYIDLLADPKERARAS